MLIASLRRLPPALLLSVLVTTPAFAQILAAEAGMTFSTQRYVGVDTSPRPGFTGGILTALSRTAPITLQTEVLFTQKGSKASTGVGDVDLDIRYLEIPVAARFNVYRTPNKSLHVFAGPSFAWRLDANFELNGDRHDVDTAAEKYDFGVVVGAGFDVGQWLVSGRYTEGLRNVNTLTADSPNAVRNRSFAAMFGVRFR